MKNSIWKKEDRNWGYNPCPGKLAPYANVTNILLSIRTNNKPITREIREGDYVIIPGELM